MPESKERQEAKIKYDRENYDRILLRLPKGYKARMKEHIGDESLNAYIKGLIDWDLPNR